MRATLTFNWSDDIITTWYHVSNMHGAETFNMYIDYLIFQFSARLSPIGP